MQNLGIFEILEECREKEANELTTSKRRFESIANNVLLSSLDNGEQPILPTLCCRSRFEISLFKFNNRPANAHT